MTVFGFGNPCEKAKLGSIATEPRNQNTFCLQNDNDITDTVADVLSRYPVFKREASDVSKSELSRKVTVGSLPCN